MKTFTVRWRNREIKLRASNVNVRNISRFFKISEDVFITINGQAEFPDAIGEFLLDEYPDRATLNINEDSPSVSTSSQQTASSTPTPTSSTQQPTNFSQTTSSRFSKRVLTTVKVIRADLGGDGKPTNIHAHNLTVHVNIYKEEDARVPYILQKVQSSMDDDILVLVGPNGLIYYDQEGTRGPAFWKVGSRKIYAVPEEDLNRAGDDVDSLLSPPALKRRRPDQVSESLVKEVSCMAEKVESFNKLAFRYRFSFSFLQTLDDAFSCCICKRTPAKTPLIGCQTCGSLVGCQTCTNRWFSGTNGLDKPCPKCRTPRGLTKSYVIKGFDDFVYQIKEMSRNGGTVVTSSEDESDAQSSDTLPIIAVDDE